MKKINILLLGLLIGLFVSCERNEDESKIYSFTGKAQKGPFVTGSIVTLNELNANLGQTGKSFTTSINTDDGGFSLSNIELNSDLALLTANGFYFSEIYGELSGATLSLQALTDLSGKESVNINVLTHLIKGRIEKLVADGMSFQEANEQAKSELITFLGVTESFDNDFDNLDISVNETNNAILLAFSIILQRYTMIWNERPTLIAELTQFLSNLSSDFATDGLINNRALIDALLYNISQLNLIDIRNNVENKYSNLGQTVTIPKFEQYIAKFQEKYSDNLYTNFTYPDSASPEPVMAPDAIIPNILVPSDTVFKAAPYSVAAIIPLNKTLKIKFIGSNITIGGPMNGWELINEYPNGFTLNSQRQNELMSMLIYLEYGGGTATIEYYENETETPTFTKKIKWK
jgi:hypothetical protein